MKNNYRRIKKIMKISKFPNSKLIDREGLAQEIVSVILLLIIFIIIWYFKL